MADLLSNARMYAVTPRAEEAWRALLAHVSEAAGIPLAYTPYPAPQPLETLWRRPDLGLAFMCGWPMARTYREVRPVAAPIPAAERFGGEPAYATDFIVRAESPYETLEDTFGGRLGWTVEHSQSGFNAVRHHLRTRFGDRGSELFSAYVGPLVTARESVRAVLDGRADVGPLDAYWHELLRLYEPETTSRLRVVATTAPTPIPPLVAAGGLDDAALERLREALVGLSGSEAGRALLSGVALRGFAPVSREQYGVLEAAAEEAERAGYRIPA